MKRKLKWIQEKIMRKKCVNENEADKTRFIKGEKKIKVVKKVYKSLIRDKKSRMQKKF